MLAFEKLESNSTEEIGTVSIWREYRKSLILAIGPSP